MSQEEIGPDLDANKYTPEQFAAFKAKFPEQDTVTLARFLIARNGDIEKSSEMLTNHLNWKAANWPVLKSTCINEVKQGKGYVRGTDLEGHPLIIFNTCLHDPNKRDVEELIRCAIFLFETAISQMKGKICKVCLMINRVSAGSSADIEFFKALSNLLQNNYPERLHRTVVYPSGFVFWGIWQVVQLFLDPVTRDKVKPVMYLSGVQEYISIDSIPAVMGGNMDYVYNEQDYPDPYPAEVIAAKLEREKLGSGAASPKGVDEALATSGKN